MFQFPCHCWALCKVIWSVSGILHKTPLGHVRDATRVVRSVWGLNPQTAFSVIHISTCCAPRTNVLALVLSITTKARTTSVKDATLPAEHVKVKAYAPLYQKEGYRNTYQGLSKSPPSPFFCGFVFFSSLLQDLETFHRDIPLIALPTCL